MKTNLRNNKLTTEIFQANQMNHSPIQATINHQLNYFPMFYACFERVQYEK